MIYRVAFAILIKIWSSVIPHRIPAQPPPQARVVPAVAAVDYAGVGAEIRIVAAELAAGADARLVAAQVLGADAVGGVVPCVYNGAGGTGAEAGLSLRAAGGPEVGTDRLLPRRSC